ncbi:spike base protein, RCAP_Rcc01079 family [Parvularcula lutaonensis]|uniref:Uncharacterized protein n=1 Tax=Parvularcula lutaonensis TaxID=491923 RepID=A0ABV7MEW2_9PROT|nr:hypothetical protein [Parvularcula lutaonensis]GGY51545.1 hypothetical protein GCM10007148_20560 [Parvularcula lutaonensis]
MTDLTTLRPGLESPPSRAFSVGPDDAADLITPIRGLMVTTGGDVSVMTTGGDTATLPSLQSGVQYAVLATRILATGTTATGIVGLA